MCEFEGIAQVDQELDRLSELPEPLVARLPRRPGQKEERWVQLLTDRSAGVPTSLPGDAFGGEATTDRVAEEPTDEAAEAAQLRTGEADLCAEVAALRRAVAELRGEMVELSAGVADLHDQLETLRRDLYG